MSATFTLPEGLAPEVYPLAWLLGSWRGYGVLAYPGIAEQPLVAEMTFDHDAGPYLRCRQTLWSIDPAHSQSVAHETPGAEGADRLAKAAVWSSESSYWRPVPHQQPGAGPTSASDGEPGASDATTTGEEPSSNDERREPGPTDIEVLLAQPSGHVAVYVGAVQGPRIEIASDAMVRTSSAGEVTAGTRMYGLVHGDLMWVEELAAFGHELQSYSSGRLSRMEQ